MISFENVNSDIYKIMNSFSITSPQYAHCNTHGIHGTVTHAGDVHHSLS
uniref:Uncharacterized protein n=1 Tax=Arundo donax TaxID=35708 RepID=A0A0A9AAK1_ARUDO